MPVRLACTALLAAAFLAAVPAADAAPRRVPQGFFGVMWDGEISEASPQVQEAQWAAMASSGVESVRAAFKWSEAQQSPGAPLDFSKTDAVVRLAASHGMSLLPVVEYAPAWARAYPRSGTSPPRSNSQYAAYVGALVARYGARGTFWSENPGVPRRPVRDWQLWNEPHLRTYWDAPRRSRWGHPRGYGALLRAAHRAIKRADPGARVVLAGITQKAWDELTLLYRRAGIRRYFDVATIQTFPQTVGRAVRAVKLFRRAMRRAGDRRKPIWVTELTWPASKGRTKGIRFQRQETPQGMAGKLSSAYPALARARRRLGLSRVYWYTWASPYGGGGSIFRYAGLLLYTGGTMQPQPALTAYQQAAQRLQGCAKDERGNCR
jgi:hypothetical protein